MSPNEQAPAEELVCGAALQRAAEEAAKTGNPSEAPAGSSSAPEGATAAPAAAPQQAEPMEILDHLVPAQVGTAHSHTGHNLPQRSSDCPEGFELSCEFKPAAGPQGRSLCYHAEGGAQLHLCHAQGKLQTRVQHGCGRHGAVPS